MGEDLVFVGIKGSVVAIDRGTGATLFAASRGRLYRLGRANGDVLWCNELSGLGYGIVSIAGASQAAPAAIAS